VNVEDALYGVTSLYIETAPFIYFTESRAVYADKMRAILAEVSGGRFRVLTSAVTIPETLMKPLRANDMPLVTRYRTMFYHTNGISVVSVSPSAGDLAAELRARYNLRTPDALHVACAIDTGCEAFLTNDTGIKRVREIRVVVLDDLELPDPVS
jgi:predicted nucleic acid-binding protein